MLFNSLSSSRARAYPALIAFFAFFPLSVFAETTDTLDPVVVTAVRQPLRADELLSDTTVITREQIVASGQSTLAELLAWQPGLQSSTSGPPGSPSSVFIHGTESRHTLVLIDGLRAGSVSVGTPNFEAIPLSQIERIEIVRGSMSALYGSEAIGGVIQIFTRRGAGRPHFDAFAGYGMYNTSELDAGISGSSGALRYSLRAGHSASDGFSATNSSAKQPYLYNPDKDGFRQIDGSLNLGWRITDDHDLAFTWLGTKGRNDYDNGPGDFNNYLDKKSDLFGLTFTSKFNDAWKSTLRIGRTTDDVTTYDEMETTRLRSTQDQAIWQNDIRLPVGQALLAYEYLRQAIDGTVDYTSNSRHVNSFLLGWNGALGPNKAHRLQINLRHDQTQFGNKTTGLVSYGYQLSDYWRAYVAYGTAFNAPTFNQLYWPDSGYGGGNPHLKAESARSGKIGIDWEAAHHKVSLVLFDNRIRDMITGWPPENTAHARIKGSSLSWAGEMGAWQFAANYDWVRARDDDNGARLPRRADHQANFSLSRSTGSWRFGGEWHLVGKRFDDSANTKPMGGYGLVNVFAHYQLNRDLRLEARINNVFDKEYESVWGYATPGANIFVGLRYQLK